MEKHQNFNKPNFGNINCMTNNNEQTLPLDPTFSDKRNAKSPLPQHKSNTLSPFFALSQKEFLFKKSNFR